MSTNLWFSFGIGKKVISIDFEFTVKEDALIVHTNFDELYIKEKIKEIEDKSQGIIILNVKVIQKILQIKGKEKFQYYIDNLELLDYIKAEKPTGLFVEAVLSEYKLTSRVKTSNKDSNSNRNNFEQRELADEYFENFFDNTPKKGA